MLLLSVDLHWRESLEVLLFWLKKNHGDKREDKYDDEKYTHSPRGDGEVVLELLVRRGDENAT